MFLQETLPKWENPDVSMIIKIPPPPILEASFYFLPFIIEIRKVQTLSESAPETDF